MNVWIQAARLRTLPLSLSGIIMGAFLAYSKGSFDWAIFLLSLLTTILYQILSNFANDLGDYQKGTDVHREGEKRLVQSGEITEKKMKSAIILTAVLASISSIALLIVAFLPKYQDEFYVFLALAAASIVAALLYTLGKKPYGYYALGDVFVFLFFGLLAVVGSEYLYTKMWDPYTLLPASAIGCFSVAVLNLNNMRDFDHDLASGKRTFAIVLGKKGAKMYEMILLTLPYLLCLIYVLQVFPGKYSSLLFLITLIPAMRIRRNIIFTTFEKEYDPYLKQVAILCLSFTIIFGIGISGMLHF